MRLMARTPRIIPRQTPSHGPSLEENLISLVHRPAACSGVKALRNTSDAKAASRQALLAFRSLDPFRALREPDRSRRDEERPFPLRTKNRRQSPNGQRINCPAPGQQPLDKKSPIQVCKLSVPNPGENQAAFGRLAIRSAYRAPAVNAYGNANAALISATNPNNATN